MANGPGLAHLQVDGTTASHHGNPRAETYGAGPLTGILRPALRGPVGRHVQRQIPTADLYSGSHRGTVPA